MGLLLDRVVLFVDLVRCVMASCSVSCCFERCVLCCDLDLLCLVCLLLCLVRDLDRDL